MPEERTVLTKMPISDEVLRARKTLHIVSTKLLAGNEVLVGFSDGSGAIYEADELEKLRPRPKRTFPNVHAIDDPLLRASA
jgi:hypothetical protein